MAYHLYVSCRRVPGSSSRNPAGIYVLWAGTEAPVRRKDGGFGPGKNAVRLAILQQPEWEWLCQACGCFEFKVRPGTCRQWPVKYAAEAQQCCCS